jgi:hypothetical protein
LKYSSFFTIDSVPIVLILLYSFVFLPLVGIPWLIFCSPRWIWYYIVDGKSRIITPENAFLEFTTFRWQKPQAILDQILNKYDGQILSASGTMKLSSIYVMGRRFSKGFKPTMEDKETNTTDSETGKTRIHIWFRLKRIDGVCVLANTSNLPIEGVNLQSA